MCLRGGFGTAAVALRGLCEVPPEYDLARTVRLSMEFVPRTYVQYFVRTLRSDMAAAARADVDVDYGSWMDGFKS